MPGMQFMHNKYWMIKKYYFCMLVENYCRIRHKDVFYNLVSLDEELNSNNKKGS